MGNAIVTEDTPKRLMLTTGDSGFIWPGFLFLIGATGMLAVALLVFGGNWFGGLFGLALLWGLVLPLMVSRVDMTLDRMDNEGILVLRRRSILGWREHRLSLADISGFEPEHLEGHEVDTHAVRPILRDQRGAVARFPCGSAADALDVSFRLNAWLAMHP